MTKRKQYRGNYAPKTQNELTYFDLKIGMKFRADGEAGRVYKIIGLESKATFSIVTLKRETDGLVLNYRADRFLPLINNSELIGRKDGSK